MICGPMIMLHRSSFEFLQTPRNSEKRLNNSADLQRAQGLLYGSPGFPTSSQPEAACSRGASFPL